MTTITAHDARSEADALLSEDQTGRVLVPSPPADTDPGWFADDPTMAGSRVDGQVVSPTSDGDIRWADVAADNPDVDAFARRHWLGPRDRLTALPDSFEQTRAALHQVAFFAIGPARHAANGKIGLRWTPGGFGTPFFQSNDGDRQVRVEGDHLVVQTGSTVEATPLTTVTDATVFLGVPYIVDWFPALHDPLAPADPNEPLSIDPVATAALDAWFGFSTAVLEELRRTPGAADVGRVQLWPEHFDPAVEMGDGDAGTRASYGASPGDAAHDGPYLYVAAWGDVDRSEAIWNDSNFAGASLSYAELLAADDQFAAGVSFLRRCHAQLTGIS